MQSHWSAVLSRSNQMNVGKELSSELESVGGMLYAADSQVTKRNKTKQNNTKRNKTKRTKLKQKTTKENRTKELNEHASKRVKE